MGSQSACCRPRLDSSTICLFLGIPLGVTPKHIAGSSLCTLLGVAPPLPPNKQSPSKCKGIHLLEDGVGPGEIPPGLEGLPGKCMTTCSSVWCPLHVPEQPWLSCDRALQVGSSALSRAVCEHCSQGLDSQAVGTLASSCVRWACWWAPPMEMWEQDRSWCRGLPVVHAGTSFNSPAPHGPLSPSEVPTGQCHI